jgi:citronellol/citronellal dehydrogenase
VRHGGICIAVRQLHVDLSSLLSSRLSAARARSSKGAAYSQFAGRSGELKIGSPLRGRTLFVSGASRGIGLAIALRAAKDGANVVIAAKTTTAQPNLPGTIYTAAAEIEAAGGKALAVQCDIRSEESVAAAIEAAVKKFGGIDILVNNASAISLTGTAETSMKKFDLMHQINTRGTFLCTQKALPYLKKSAAAGRNPHVLNLGPPLSAIENSGWWRPHPAYTLAKFGMSAFTLAHSAEFKEDGIAVNSLWPLSTIATAAVQNLLGGSDMVSRSRKADIMADSAYLILTAPSKTCSGQCFVDEHVLKNAGVSKGDMDKYAITPGTAEDQLAPDFFV